MNNEGKEKKRQRKEEYKIFRLTWLIGFQNFVSDAAFSIPRGEKQEQSDTCRGKRCATKIQIQV